MLNKKEKEIIFNTALQAYKDCKHEANDDVIFIQDNNFWYCQGMLTMLCHLGLEEQWQEWSLKHLAD